MYFLPHTMDNAMRGAMTRERLMSVMTGAFPILATLVAAIGLYGMFAYAVAQRIPENGLRMASERHGLASAG